VPYLMRPMRIVLDYGKTGLEVEIPDANLAGVLAIRPQPPLVDPDAAVRAALDQPIGSLPLADLARGKRSACVVISDITRPVPNQILLPPILQTLESSGIPRAEITILIATGTHRPNEGDELRSMVGADVASQYRLVNHDARDRDAHLFLGMGPRGVPIWVDRRYLEADLRLSTALIEPHFMAGYSGGRKSICPGICSIETVKVWHGPRFIGHERSDSGILDGNPVHEEALYAARASRVDFIADVTLDAERRLTGVFAGDLEEAWIAGVRSVEHVVQSVLAAPVDIVVTSSAGYPLDLTFYQAVKGMVGALPAMKAGGTVIIVSRCAEGLGSRDFESILLGNDSIEAFVAETYGEGFFIPDQWEVHELAKALRKAEVLCFSEGIPAETLSRCFVTPISSVEAGLERALGRHGPRARIAVIPKGPYVVPVTTTGQSA
jgi:lactate racemase